MVNGDTDTLGDVYSVSFLLVMMLFAVGNLMIKYKVWCGMVWYGMVWYDMVWYDVIWCDMVWYDVIWWYGMV